jgi:hypothetical protein
VKRGIITPEAIINYLTTPHSHTTTMSLDEDGKGDDAAVASTATTPGSMMAALLAAGTALSELVAYLHLYVSNGRKVTEPLFVLNEAHAGLVADATGPDQLWRTVVKGLLSDVSSCGHFASTVQTCVYGFVEDETVKGPGAGDDSSPLLLSSKKGGESATTVSPLGLLQWLLDHGEGGGVLLLRCAYECRDASTDEREDSHVFLLELQTRAFLAGLRAQRSGPTVSGNRAEAAAHASPATAESLFAAHTSRRQTGEGARSSTSEEACSEACSETCCGYLLQSEERRYDCSVKPVSATDMVWILGQLQRYHLKGEEGEAAVVSAEDVSVFVEFTSVDVPLGPARPTRLVNTGPYVEWVGLCGNGLGGRRRAGDRGGLYHAGISRHMNHCLTD